MRTGPAVRAIAGVVTLEAVRGRVPWLMLLVLLAGFALSEFTAEVAITESREISRGLLGARLRVAAVVVVALFVSGSMAREWSDKGMEMVLALALPRGAYLAGRLAGYAVVALACALACTLVVAVFVPPFPALVWGVTLACELLIVAALSLLCLLTLGHVTLGLSAVMAFYLLSRVMDAIRLMGASTLSVGDPAARQATSAVLDLIAFLLPDLDRFARSEWLIHGNAAASDLYHALGQSAVYLALLAGAALFDLQRKVL